jgi:hypothetical protein
MVNELTALEKNKTWSLVTLPPGKKPVNCRWVYKIKYKADGTIERHKARLVAKGFTQTEGIDFFETYNPVAKLTSVRFLVSLAAACNWYLFQLDVDNAFLHGDLDEEVYMKPPPGLQLPHPKMVCKIQKSLYGLRQASRNWNKKLTSILAALGYKQISADYSLFVKISANSFTAILVYVDDIILCGNDIQ